MPAAISAPIPAFPELSTRDLRSVTAETEKKVLVALAKRMPSWIGPDHLTALGGLAMAGAGLCYRFLAVSPLALLGVNLFLFLNWFGDSLDGTLARVRRRQRQSQWHKGAAIITACGWQLVHGSEEAADDS